MERPWTKFAWNGDVALAYQVFGDGPLDLLYVEGWASNIDIAWESPYLGSFLRRLGEAARVVFMDRRGRGLSDRFSPDAVSPFEILADDILVVLDAAGVERAVVMATTEAAPLAFILAATHPDRVSALVLCDPSVSYSANEDFPDSNTAADWEAWFERLRTEDVPRPVWWDGPPDHPERDWFFRWCRASEGVGALIAEFRRFRDTDVRAVLPSVRVPTLLLVDPDGSDHLAGDPAGGRYAAARIPGARLVEVRGEHFLAWPHWYGRADGIVRETKAFLAELHEEETRLDRILATVLFTDIVGSTARAAALGDRAWRDVLEEHHAIVRALLTRYRGTEVDTAGDGFMATFDGPARAIRCAQSIVESVESLGLEVRAGVHTGEVETIAGKVGGIAVNIAARVSAEASPSEVLASQTVRDLVAGSGIRFEARGRHALKGVPDEWVLYAVVQE
ncbi:MAG TPA: adenylate/guanylate cyclase domain-containing protein [Gaiellaceae bacterium]|nr:adenylate/guanylate cyclase domain-containing protein [Gaiellaceae bacterium]